MILHYFICMDCSQDTKKKIIEDCKVPRKSGKWGVLSCVTEFSNFAEQSERIVMGAEQREEINTAYQVLIQSLFDTIERVANEHPKTRDVVKFGECVCVCVCVCLNSLLHILFSS